MNWNPYKRLDYKNLSDVELQKEVDGFSRKQNICMGVTVCAAAIALVAVGAIFFPAVLPAVPVYISNFMIAGSLFSQNRFAKLGRECRAEKHARMMANLNQHLANITNTPASAPIQAPAPAPAAKPAFNSQAATVLDEDIEINKPLKFKKKAQQPGTTV